MKGLKDMVTALMTVDKIIETKSKKPSEQEAADILRLCGILDNKNMVKPAYRNILVKKENKKNGDK